LLGINLVGVKQADAQSTTPSPQQIELFQSLSEEERRQLLQRSGGGGSAPQQVIEDIAVVAPRAVEESVQNDIPAGDVQQRLGESQQSQENTRDLQPFGYELFAGTPTTFAPATNIPVPSTYIVGPGDTVIIQLYGQQNITYQLVVTREGQLMFPQIGPVNVSGQSFEDVRSQLQGIVANQLIGQSASITMGPLRSISVFVLGEASRPGSYTVSSLSTMTNALFVSGGVTTVGSLRRIRLMRAGQQITELDLYDLLLRGDTSGDARLLPGDVIFVPPVGRTVGIAGEVRRPAIYEIKDETAVAEVLSLSGGLKPTAFPSASRLERINEQGERTLIDVDLTDTENSPTLADGDLLQIDSVLDQLESVVLLEGHVKRPGGFEWREGIRVSDFLPSVELLLPDPDLQMALIAREVQPTRRIELVPVSLGEAINNPGSSADVLLQPRDQLHTFGASQDRRPQLEALLDRLNDQASFDSPPLSVTVTGNVRYPGQYPLVGGMTLGGAIRFAGGLLTDSDVDNVLLERRIDQRGSVAVERYALDGQTLSSRARVSLRELDKVIVFGATQAREELLSDTLEKLRLQAAQDRPTEIVGITGRVRFPGDYPLIQGATAGDAIALAGGLSESADPGRAEVTSFEAESSAGLEAAHTDIDLAISGVRGRDYRLEPFDQLVVRQIPNWVERERVVIGGEVASPGTYSITKRETLSSLIMRAGGLTEFADPAAAIFLREELAKNEQLALEDYREQLEQELANAALQEDGASAAEAQALLDSLDDVTPTGRLVIDLPRLLSLRGGASADVSLRSGDEILIPRAREEVTVTGEVRQPTSHLFDADLSVADYIASSGAFNQDADRRGVYVIRSSGEVVPFGGARWFFQQRSRVQPGDTIVVPRDIYRADQLQLWTSVSQILFNISTTLLAIERVGN
jgi:polysaccharide export outer membrane protein